MEVLPVASGVALFCCLHYAQLYVMLAKNKRGQEAALCATALILAVQL